MSPSNIEIVQRGIDAWNRGDTDVTLAGLHPDVEWTTGLIDASETFRGHEGVERFWRIFTDAWQDITLEAERYFEVEDKVVVLGHFHARGRDSGIEIDAGFGHIYRFRDGLIIGFHGLAREDAVAAAGLDPAEARPTEGR